MIPPDLALVAWIPIVLLAFLLLPNRTAVLVTVVLGWSLLPLAGFSIPGFIDYNKSTAIAMAGIVGVIVFDPESIRRLIPNAWDLPMMLFCLLPGITMVYLGYAPYAAMSSILYGILGYAVPYFLGRLYFSDMRGLRELALGIMLGALLYVPLCLYEIRMSPQLNNIVYGFSQHSFLQSIRYGGYRPVVFMSHGLMVGLWMAAGTLIALQMWRTHMVTRIMGVPMGPIVALLFIVTVWGKSTGALILLFIASAALLEFHRWRHRWIFALIIFAPLLYIGVRVTNSWSGEGLLDLIAGFSPERAQSLAFRMNMEDQLMHETLPYYFTGRGPWGFTAVQDSQGREVKIVTDSLWIIVFASSGFLTLLSMLGAFVRPLIVMWRRLKRSRAADRNLLCAFTLALVLGMFFIDSVFNAMVNPAYLLIMGGLTGWGMHEG